MDAQLKSHSEINEAVARKLGWFQSPSNGRWGRLNGHPQENMVVSVPDYCHSIAAAWEIVDKIEWFCLEKNHSKGTWWVWDMAGTEEAQMICEAATAPMAICLAFLKEASTIASNER